MTHEKLTAVARRMSANSRKQQGLPVRVTDPAAVAQVASLLQPIPNPADRPVRKNASAAQERASAG